MLDQYFFDFKTDISDVAIPEQLNNPFGLDSNYRQSSCHGI